MDPQPTDTSKTAKAMPAPKGMPIVEGKRQNFRALILANPNYFGNMKESGLEPVLNVVGDTAYEELGCVGLNQQLDKLEGVVYIKQSTGYGGDICSSGTQEYVRFYLSYDGGATWQDQGVVSFTAYDIPNTTRLEYAVALPINPAEYFCFFENLPKVRAILSWNFVPPAGTPNFVPVWGNVVDANVQIPAASFIILAEVMKEAKVELPQKLKGVLDLTQSVPLAKPKKLSAMELQSLYKGGKVPGHRFLYAEIQKFVANPASSTQAKPMAAKMTMAKSMMMVEPSIDYANIIPQLLDTSGDTGYEQLNCVGLNPNLGALEGVLTVKLPFGYSGGLCTAGSEEYVAFWVDWGDGAGWTYVGTAMANVHDISGIPAGGLEYAVYLPVNVAAHQQPCEDGPKLVNVRAILSWQTPPPPGDPNYVPVWGNRVDTLVNLKPGDSFSQGTARISILGGVGIADINTGGDGMTKPTALFALTGDNADGWGLGRECPFGTRIVVQGPPSVGSKYRVWARKFGAATANMLTDPIWTVDQFGVGTWQNPDGSGFFNYLDTLSNIDNILAYWDSVGDDLWQVMLELADNTDTVLNSTPWYNIQLDNTWPTPNPPLFPPTVDIHISSGGDCKDFPVPTPITGTFVAIDTNMGAYYLYTLPFGTPPGTLTPTVGYVSTPPGGSSWNLDTTGMTPCGYVVKLDVYDRAILDSSPGNHHVGSASVGFCLRAS